MMPPRQLLRFAARNALRNRRHFLMSSLGIAVGIAAFAFFLGLSSGVRRVVLGQIFPLERVEVVAPTASLLGMDASKRLDDAVVAALRARPEVAEVVPRMAMVFPATGRGGLGGRHMAVEVGGFLDGISPSFVAGEEFAARFREAVDPADLPACSAALRCPDSDFQYCDRSDLRCHRRVPAIVSPKLLELYNGQLARAHGLPILPEGSFHQVVQAFGGWGKMRFTILLGDTMMSGTNRNVRAPLRQVEAVVVGVSDKAMDLGLTVPIGYVRAWNREYVGEAAAKAYSSIVVVLRDKDQLAPLAAWLKQAHGLQLKDSQGERFGTVIFIVTVLFLVISFVVVGISAINIAHNFFMQVSERRKEIGVLRAVGATRADVRGLILGEAAFIGIIGGLLGLGTAIAAGWGIDMVSRHFLPDFPFKPETYFHFHWWILTGGLLFSVIFCVLGGYLPARRAAAMEPAQALAQH
jgi:ABC-type antimicrobial peptide transport system permease subunit